MEQDFTQQQGLDSSILNSGFLGGGNRPIGRGKRVKFKRRALPFYYGANGEMVMMSEPAPIMEQSFAPAPIMEQSLAPQQVVEYTQPVTQQVVEQVQPISEQLVQQVSYSPAPTESYIPNNNTVIAEALPPQNNQPIYTQVFSEPVVLATTPTQTPTQFSTPIVAQTNIPSTPQTTTSSTTTTTTTSAPKPVVAVGGGMPMGGGGGGVAPASKPASTTTTTTTKAPNGVVQQKTTTTTFEKQGMSKGMKFGIVALLLVGGYLAYKNRTKLGF